MFSPTAKDIIEDKASELIAIQLQKLKRGNSARSLTKLKKYEKYVCAACIIQRYYRSYRIHNHFTTILKLKSMKRKKQQLKRLKKEKEREEQASLTSVSFQNQSQTQQTQLLHPPPTDTDRVKRDMKNLKKVMSGKANFDEKMSFWRKCIELRRAHGSYSTEVGVYVYVY